MIMSNTTHRLTAGDRHRLKGYAWLFLAGAIAFGIGLIGLIGG